MTTVVSIENISKVYRLGILDSKTFSSDMRQWWGNLRRNPTPVLADGKVEKKDPDERYIWALRDLTFGVQQSEAIGIIGRNGAGKSTLLKILSRVTAPTSGQIKVKGRVASLLEVGTGFNPELTGRDNIYLNGAILGMSRAEIDRKFDEIVDFSGVEKFIDTPVKRYSSGMYVRLGFAVAAHLEPDILVVDEVLAVGDAGFQKKCLGKMSNVVGQGRTVLFVSHNMAAISSLCSKAVVLKDGMADHPLADTETAIRHYMSQVSEITQTELSVRSDRQGNGLIRMTGFDVLDERGQAQDFVLSGQNVEFRIHFECVNNPDPRNISTAISITGLGGSLLTVLSNELASAHFDSIPQRGFVRCIVPRFPLSAGQYSMNLIIRQNDLIQDWIQEAAVLYVDSGDYFGTGRVPPASHGGVLIDQKWEVRG